MFENLKRIIKEKQEKNGVKVPGIEYTDKKGVTHKEDIILKRSKLPFIGDWTRIYPPVNEDNSWNIFNLVFGGKKNFIKLLFFLGLAAMILMGYDEIFSSYSELRTLCEPYLNTIKSYYG